METARHNMGPVSVDAAALLLPLDRERLRREFIDARPFPFIVIDELLDPKFADEVSKAYPSLDAAAGLGHSFATVNERRKVQITKADLFPDPIKRLNSALASAKFLDDLSYITGMKNLLADEQLAGGGMHLTGPGGRLDVHVDFNYLDDRALHRRMNLLLYLNPLWQPEWGGAIQLWDRKVKKCHHEFTPKLNRCLIFETSDISYHGVTPVHASTPVTRQSFAAYYYTREVPAAWRGSVHSTVFRARPDEWLRGSLLMPVESLHRQVRKQAARVKRGLASLGRRLLLVKRT